MADFIAQMIINGMYTYDFVISRRPDLKEGIDKYLIAKGREDLITKEEITDESI